MVLVSGSVSERHMQNKLSLILLKQLIPCSGDNGQVFEDAQNSLGRGRLLNG